MFKYETHLHTCPVSRCASGSVEESLKFYKSLGYDGVFVTNHFLDGNIAVSNDITTYEEKINFYFSDYEKGLIAGKKLDIKVFSGVEISYLGTDFLIYGLDKEWYLNHPEIMDMKKSQELNFFAKHGALVIQAHPFREAGYIDHIRLYPRNIHGVEVINASMNQAVNNMAMCYAEHYELIKFAGSDNHVGKRGKLAGVSFDEPIKDEMDFVEKIKNGMGKIFSLQCKIE